MIEVLTYGNIPPDTYRDSPLLAQGYFEQGNPLQTPEREFMDRMPHIPDDPELNSGFLERAHCAYCFAWARKAP
jgi:hypothetical protein